eukprot:gene29638-38761_t
MNPKVVATSFIKQYYAVFSTTPSELYKFYSSDSQFTHCENNQIGKSVSGSEEIREEVAQLNLQGAQLDLSNGFVDVQPRGEDILGSVFRLLSSSATTTTVDSSSSTGVDALVGEPTPPTSSSSSAVDLTYHTAPAVVVEPPAVPAAAPVSVNVPVSVPVSAPSSAMSSSVAAAAVAGQSSKSYSDIVRKLTEAKTISSDQSQQQLHLRGRLTYDIEYGVWNHLHEDATQSDLQRSPQSVRMTLDHKEPIEIAGREDGQAVAVPAEVRVTRRPIPKRSRIVLFR